MAETAVPAVTTDELRALLADPSRRWWLVHATDTVVPRRSHPGCAGSPRRHPAAPTRSRSGRRACWGIKVVVYGEDEDARDARDLASRLGRGGVEVAWYTGGLAAWSAAGLPVERSG